MQEILVSSGSKEEVYKSLLPQIQALVAGEEDTIANLANICGALKQAFNWWWVGFYFVKGEELVLGPYQGPVACTRIAFGKGVCGSCWKEEKTIVVPDVHAFPGHIACSSASLSEIVVPCFKNGSVWAVLDVDSELLAHFDEVDAKYLQEIVQLIP